MQPTFTTIQEARRWASLFLQKHKREMRVADLLLENLLGWTQAQLLAFETDLFPEGKKQTFIEDVQAHAETGVPVQHLIGHAYFYGREFKVNEHVLIPRPETEELVLGMVDFLKSHSIQHPKIADIGTGSGVIAVTAALEVPDSHVYAVDLSGEALKISTHNAEALGAEIEFYQGDFLEPLQDTPVDILISNPPYIAYEEKERMNDTVVNFDPDLALFAEDEGLAAYQTMLNQLSTCGWRPLCIAFEIGYQQGVQVKEMINGRFPHYHTEVRKDINGKDRMVFAMHETLKK